MAILRVRDENGNSVEIPAIIGPAGKSAYEYAKDGGYNGTEEEFESKLAAEWATKGEISELLGQIKDLNGLTYGIYVGDTQPINGVMYWLDTSGDIEEEPETPVEPDVPEVTLSSITATYTGGEVTVGTALTDLTGITVTATYSDGTTANVIGYTLSGTIAEGSSTITVSYGGKTTTFTVIGVAESGGEDSSLTVEQVKELVVFHGAPNASEGVENSVIADLIENGFIIIDRSTSEYGGSTLRARSSDGALWLTQSVADVLTSTRTNILEHTQFDNGNYYKANKYTIDLLDGTTPEEKASLFSMLWLSGTQYTYAWVLKMNDYNINDIVELIEEVSA